MNFHGPLTDFVCTLTQIPVEDKQYAGDAELFEDDDPTYCQVRKLSDMSK